MENSELVGRYGLERFMEGQKEKYTCPICGGVISVHDGECSECQEKVQGWEGGNAYDREGRGRPGSRPCRRG